MVVFLLSQSIALFPKFFCVTLKPELLLENCHQGPFLDLGTCFKKGSGENE